MQANHRDDPSPDNLTDILKKNIFGVDKDRKAIRIAALSLYLTMCDYLPPLDIWDKVKFEPLINENSGNNLFVSDFFEEDASFLNKRYDLIIGNPPWQSRLSEPARRYIDKSGKSIGDKQICQAFLWRVAELCEPTGEICMLVSSKALLFNRSKPNKEFRMQFLSTFRVKTIINFSALRHILFSKAAGPGAAVIFSTDKTDKKSIFYCSPKPSYSPQDDWLLIIEPQDINHIPQEEAKNDIIWKVAMWGTPRDYELIKRLSGLSTVGKICKKKNWVDGEGFIIGKKGKKEYIPELSKKPYVDARKLQRFAMNEKSLPNLTETRFYRHAKTQREIFQGPHLLIKQSPRVRAGLIAAVLKEDAIFSSSIIGIHGGRNDLNQLVACCLVINSKIALYYEMLTSRKWLVERDSLQKEEIMNFPIPEIKQDTNYKFLKELSENPNAEEIVNDMVAEWYDLDESEMILINDAIDFTLDSFRNKDKSIAFEKVDISTLENYANTFCNVLNNSFSSPKKVFVGTVYLGKCLLQVVSASLVDKSKEVAEITFVKDNELEDVLNELDKALIEEQSPSVYIRRNLRRYSGNTVFIVKPNQMMCWTKSSALHDADETYADIMLSWGDIK
jgi:hypothetical protein